MISIVICSVNKNLAEQVRANIAKTIGVDWEIIVIDNNKEKRAITHVYNKGVKLAKFPIVCFIHEDIAFQTQNWGSHVFKCFEKDASLGMIGIAGSRYKGRTPSGWMTGIESYDRYNIAHQDPNGSLSRLHFDQPPRMPLKEVVSLDGVFMCARKEVVEKIQFDENILTGFHLYDIDISFRISRQYKVAVTFEVDIIHFTVGGNFGNDWVCYTLDWHKKYKADLPVFVDEAKDQSRYRDERDIRKFWLRRLGTEKISFANKLKWMFRSRSWMDPGLWIYVAMFFLLPYFKVGKKPLAEKANKPIGKISV
jgi:hypothetical protein